MGIEIEQPSLDEYPLNRVGGKIELLDAETIYRFKNSNDTDGRWLAVLKIKSTFGRNNRESVSVRIYRWRWRQPTKWNQEQRKRVPEGEYRWFLEQKHNINKREIWERTRAAVDKFLSNI